MGRDDVRVIRQARPPRQALVVEDYVPLQALVSDALRGADFEVVSFGAADQAITKCQVKQFDVLITDIELPGRPNGVELAAILRAQDPGLAIVFLTNYPSPTAFANTISPPTPHAFLQKSRLESTQVLLDVVESALDETRPLAVVSEPAANPLSNLTTSQLDVVRLIAAGFTNAEIARRRGTNQRAVERMAYRIFAMLDINNDPAHNPRVVISNLYSQTYGHPVLAEEA